VLDSCIRICKIVLMVLRALYTPVVTIENKKRFAEEMCRELCKEVS
jgi:hypothetical protein